MKKATSLLILAALQCAMSAPVSARTWTLEECMKYAMDNNITLKRAAVSRQSAVEDVKQSKAQLLPSLNFGTSQNVTYTPWRQMGTATVADGRVEASVENVTYNGSYSVNTNWTVWNGNRNHNTVKMNKVAERQAEMDSVASARDIQERIAQLYIQILYTKEAIAVNKATLEAAKVNEERGRQLLKVGTMSQADQSQLTAQRAQDEYNVVQAESQARSYTSQLRQLLQLTDGETFDVAVPELTSDMALKEVPSLPSVYEAALDNRPEIRRAMLNVESADLQRKVAVAQRMPTVTMNASIGASTNSMNKNGWADQMKTNTNIGGGISVSFPILDQRNARTAINKARLRQQDAMLEVRDRQTTLYSTVEDYWIQAGNYQNQYRAATASTKSAQDSYNLLSEQFAVGLKNIVELQEGKTRLLSAQQNELQSKYMAILNLKMLEFYMTGK